MITLLYDNPMECKSNRNFWPSNTISTNPKVADQLELVEIVVNGQNLLSSRLIYESKKVDVSGFTLICFIRPIKIPIYSSTHG